MDRFKEFFIYKYKYYILSERLIKCHTIYYKISKHSYHTFNQQDLKRYSNIFTLKYETSKLKLPIIKNVVA